MDYEFTEDNAVKPITWQEFREAGLLWWANRILHVFGFAIVFTMEKDGTISKVYPARCRFRGFSEESESRGFKRLTATMERLLPNLAKDVAWKSEEEKVDFTPEQEIMMGYLGQFRAIDPRIKMLGVDSKDEHLVIFYEDGKVENLEVGITPHQAIELLKKEIFNEGETPNP